MVNVLRKQLHVALATDVCWNGGTYQISYPLGSEESWGSVGLVCKDSRIKTVVDAGSYDRLAAVVRSSSQRITRAAFQEPYVGSEMSWHSSV